MKYDLLDQVAKRWPAYPGLAVIPNDLVYLMGCGGFKQFCSTLRGLIDPEQYCPFCRAERQRRARQPTHSIGHWMLLENEFPRQGTKQMWLVLPFRHITNMSELEGRDWEEIGRLISHCTKSNNIEGGGMMCRFGDPHFHAGTVEHLHIHIIEPTPGIECREPFAKTEADHAKNYRRMLAFRDEMVAQGGIKWLSSKDGLRETQPTA